MQRNLIALLYIYIYNIQVTNLYPIYFDIFFTNFIKLQRSRDCMKLLQLFHNFIELLEQWNKRKKERERTISIFHVHLALKFPESFSNCTQHAYTCRYACPIEGNNFPIFSAWELPVSTIIINYRGFHPGFELHRTNTFGSACPSRVYVRKINQIIQEL